MSRSALGVFRTDGSRARVLGGLPAERRDEAVRAAAWLQQHGRRLAFAKPHELDASVAAPVHTDDARTAAPGADGASGCAAPAGAAARAPSPLLSSARCTRRWH